MRVPVLPIVDLLVLVASVAFVGAIVIKLVALFMGIRVFIEPMDLVTLASVLLLFAITLVGRDWLKANEPAARAGRRAHESIDAYKALRSEADELVEEREAG